jgi:hypothetical protein
MRDKKHIDRLFQEHFKDFEVAPPETVWNKIEDKLNQDKKKRRVIPVWWRYAGVAALFLLLLTIGGVFFNNNTTEPLPIKMVGNEELQTRSTNASNDNKIAIEQDPSETNNIEAINTQSSNKISSNSENIVAESTLSKTSTTTNKNESLLNGASNKKTKAQNILINSNKNQTVASNSEVKNDVSVSDKSKNLNEAVKNNTSQVSAEKAKTLINNASKDNNGIAEVKKDKSKENLLTIEEALDKTKDEIADDKTSNKWRIAPNAAPVYFNTLGEGSSIDPQFNTNSKTGELNMSYGVNASYAVNDKLKVRSGINKVNLGYNTNNVIVYQSVGVSSSTRSLKNITSSASSNSSDNISIISGENLNSGSFDPSNTSINQSFGYIEVPLEIEYTLINKKLGINVIGGFSSFFLSDNKIYSETESGSKTYLGQANNINNVSYSANFGFGFNYQVSKKIDLNVEPMFKYQINTFNNTSGDFNPYFIGVYTGFAIKF